MQENQENRLQRLMVECGLFDNGSSSNSDDDEDQPLSKQHHRNSQKRSFGIAIAAIHASNDNDEMENNGSPISSQKESSHHNTQIRSFEPAAALTSEEEINSTIDDQGAVLHQNEDLHLNPETGFFECVQQLVENPHSLALESRKRAVLNAETGIIEYVSDTETESDVENKKPNIGKKRRSLPKLWKKNKDKQKRLKNHQMREIPKCRCDCKKKIKTTEATNIFKKFINLSTHTEQNIYLQGCIKEVIPKRYRPRKHSGKPRRVFTYHLQLRHTSVQVCASAFLAIHGIKKDRLKKKVLQKHEDITDGRGRHNNHPCKVNEENLKRVHEFISSLPSQASHYSRTDNKHKKYLEADLSIAELHRKFLDTNPDLKEVVSYAKFRQIFNYDFNLSFGTPRKDICNICEKFKVNIMSAQLEQKTDIIRQLNVEKELHLRKAEVFTKKLENAEDATDEQTLSISFDFQKNLPLPVTNIQDEYYRRQLWLHNFGIHNMKENTACMYLFTENYCHKGPDEVITALNDYLDTYKKPEHKRLEIFCDNCFSQNKNRYIFTYLDQLCSKGLFQDVVIHYPIPGHSMMPIDRDFALIELKRLRKQTIYNPEYYVQLIKMSRIQNPFDVVFLEKNLTKNGSGKTVKVKDFKGLYNDYVKAVPGISTCREVRFSKFNRPSQRESMTGAFKPILLYRVGVGRIIRRDPSDAYNGPIPLKPAKVKDILHLLQFVPEAEKYYFENLYRTETNEELTRESSEEERE